ncbi:DUF739 family protein [Wukongibacter sp. M2B1]|uniref:DUF739 family protein n=1 Tax=Wukongibacter sp. M2B1 TaxID=3088895 RepID=UPI003D7A7FA5
MDRKIKALLVQHGYGVKDLATLLEIGITTTYEKLNGKSEFKHSEIKKIVDFFELDGQQIKEIFFSNIVRNNRTSVA